MKCDLWASPTPAGDGASSVNSYLGRYMIEFFTGVKLINELRKLLPWQWLSSVCTHSSTILDWLLKMGAMNLLWEGALHTVLVWMWPLFSTSVPRQQQVNVITCTDHNLCVGWSTTLSCIMKVPDTPQQPSQSDPKHVQDACAAMAFLPCDLGTRLKLLAQTMCIAVDLM